MCQISIENYYRNDEKVFDFGIFDFMMKIPDKNSERKSNENIITFTNWINDTSQIKKRDKKSK